MVSLLAEFDSELAGVAIFADNASARSKDLFDHKSLLRVTNIDVAENKIDVEIARGVVITVDKGYVFADAEAMRMSQNK